ncbi:hypothetical protein C0J52_26077 [Blattella germanica]|nr:hypothetical protein C0J52_26077 [Blattella germanica]
MNKKEAEEIQKFFFSSPRTNNCLPNFLNFGELRDLLRTYPFGGGTTFSITYAKYGESRNVGGLSLISATVITIEAVSKRTLESSPELRRRSPPAQSSARTVD